MRSSTIISQYNSPVVKIPGTVTPTERVTDGDFANWNTALYPDGWSMWDAVNDGTPNPTGWDRSTDVQAGTYSLELTANLDTGGGYASAVLTGFYDTAVAEKTIQARFYAKYTTGTPVIGVIPKYWDGVNDYVWDITSGDWMIDGTEDNSLEQVAITGSYTQVTSTQRTLPAGATEFWFDIVVVGNQNDVALLDNVEWLLDGADVATNGTMEAWTEYANPFSPLSSWSFEPGTNWGFDPLDVGDNSHITRGTDTQAGTYAVEMLVLGSGNGERGFVYQTITRPAGTSIDLSVYTKTSDAQTPYLICLDGVDVAMTQQYDFVADTWDTQGTSPTDLPGTSNAKTLSGTTSYVENTHTVTVPASGTLVVVLMTDDGDDGAGYTYKFDTVTANEDVTVPSDPVDLYRQFAGGVDIADLDSGDVVGGMYDKDDDIIIGWTSDDAGGLAPLTDLNKIDFSAHDMRFGSPSVGGNPVTKTYWDANKFTTGDVKETAVYLFGTVAVDLKVQTTYALGTVPAGYTFRPVYFQNKTTALDAPDNFSSVGIGYSAPNYDEVTSPAQQPSGTVGVVQTVALTSTHDIPAESALVVSVNTADGGTALNADYSLYGILIAV
jgi:hypothetical protein